jgi:hypothetical protein
MIKREGLFISSLNRHYDKGCRIYVEDFIREEDGMEDFILLSLEPFSEQHESHH